MAKTTKQELIYIHGDGESDPSEENSDYFPPHLTPAAKASLKAMYDLQDKEDEISTVGKRAE